MTPDRTQALSTWVAVIAGGEPLAALAAAAPAGNRWDKALVPAAYRLHSGTRSMLRRTLDRALQLAPGERVITVIQARHRAHLEAALDGASPGLLLAEPHDRGSASAMLLAAAHVLERDREATLIVMPASHAVHPEDRFVRTVAMACEVTRRLPDRIALLGAVPDGSETARERIPFPLPWAGELAHAERESDRAGAPAAGKAGPGPGRRSEEGRRGQATRNGWLRNTNIVAARASALWQVAESAVPDIVRRFSTLRRVLRLALDGAVPATNLNQALDYVYEDMGHTDFSPDILHRAPESVLTLSLEGIMWSDWSRPVRAPSNGGRARGGEARTRGSVQRGC